MSWNPITQVWRSQSKNSISWAGQFANSGKNFRAPGSVRNSVFGPSWPDLIGPTVSRQCNNSSRTCRSEVSNAGCGCAPNSGTERFPPAIHGRGPLTRPGAGGQAVEIAAPGHDPSTTKRSPKRIANPGRNWCQNSGGARHGHGSADCGRFNRDPRTIGTWTQTLCRRLRRSPKP